MKKETEFVLGLPYWHKEEINSAHVKTGKNVYNINYDWFESNHYVSSKLCADELLPHVIWSCGFWSEEGGGGIVFDCSVYATKVIWFYCRCISHTRCKNVSQDVNISKQYISVITNNLMYSRIKLFYWNFFPWIDTTYIHNRSTETDKTWEIYINSMKMYYLYSKVVRAKLFIDIFGPPCLQKRINSFSKKVLRTCRCKSDRLRKL